MTFVLHSYYCVVIPYYTLKHHIQDGLSDLYTDYYLTCLSSSVQTYTLCVYNCNLHCVISNIHYEYHGQCKHCLIKAVTVVKRLLSWYSTWAAVKNVSLTIANDRFLLHCHRFWFHSVLMIKQIFMVYNVDTGDGVHVYILLYTQRNLHLFIITYTCMLTHLHNASVIKSHSKDNYNNLYLFHSSEVITFDIEMVVWSSHTILPTRNDHMLLFWAYLSEQFVLCIYFLLVYTQVKCKVKTE